MIDLPVEALKEELTRVLLGDRPDQPVIDPDWIKAMSVLDVERARAADAKMMPEDDDDLHEYVHAYTGFAIPQETVCDKHVSPFSFIADPFFERETYVLGWANRTGGKTLNTAILHHLNMFLKREIEYDISCVGAVREQASKTLSYVKYLSQLRWFHSDCLYSHKEKLGYRWGGNIQVLAGTMSGVNSPHPVCAAFDEIELMSNTVLQEGYSMPLSKGIHKAMMVMTSTHKFSTGIMQRILHRIKHDPSYPFKAYPWCVFEVLRNCGVSPDCERCKKAVRINTKGEEESFASLCDRRGTHSNGFYVLDDVLSKFILLDAQTFDAQWLCLKPGGALLIFKAFDMEVHCARFPIPWLSGDEAVRRQWKPYILMDMGWTEPLCVLIVGVDEITGVVYVVDEFYQSQAKKEAVAEWLNGRYVLYSLFEHYESGRVTVHTDKHDPRSITEFRDDHGIWCWPVDAPIMAGIQAVRPYFEAHITKAHPPIWFHVENVRATPAELETYSWKKDKQSGLPTGEAPANHQPDHGIDLLRYLMMLLGKIPGIGQAVVVTEKEASLVSPSETPTNSRWMKRTARLATDKWRRPG